MIYLSNLVKNMKMILNIEPKPQTRPRFSKFGTYEDPKMKAWRRQCSQLIEQEYDGQFFDGPIMVDVTFYMKAPLSVSKKPTPKARAKTWDIFKRFMAEMLWNAKKPDVDNLVKSLMGVKKTMTNIRLQNPYMDETIKVKEDLEHILDMLEWLEVGNIQCLQLHQIEPKDRMITISPKNFAKIDYYEEEVEDEN